MSELHVQREVHHFLFPFQIDVSVNSASLEMKVTDDGESAVLKLFNSRD